jgi:SAM-dependent methyltransferase
MRFRNKFGINLFDNPLREKPDLLDSKNSLESTWYDKEAQDYLKQIPDASGLLPIDHDFEEWFASFYDNSDIKYPYDRDYAFFNLFAPEKKPSILELGFGNGSLSRFFIRRHLDVTSLDVSIEYCRFLLKSEPRSRPLKACAEILPFKPASFDIVTAFVALHHFNLNMALGEISRVLKPGGRGVFIEPLANSKFLYNLRQLIPIEDHESPGGGGLNERELIELLEMHGFAYEIQEFEIITRLERIPGLAIFQKNLRKIDHALLSALPFLRQYARTAVIEIKKNRNAK